MVNLKNFTSCPSHLPPNSVTPAGTRTRNNSGEPRTSLAGCQVTKFVETAAPIAWPAPTNASISSRATSPLISNLLACKIDIH